MKVQYFFAGRRLVWIVLFAVLIVLLLTAATSHAAPEQSCGFYHHVQYGQTLASIGRYYGVSVTALMHANPHIKNPNLIYAGTNIYIPCGTPPGHPGHPGMGGMCRHQHYVQYGQTLSQIAYYYHVSPYKIMHANGLHNPDLIFAGTYLCIP
jgi:LysM repeat protein